jgi:hypothetical protein
MAQALAEHIDVAFAIEQTVPQAPQLVTLFVVFTSHPLPATPSQLPQPALQEATPQAPAEQPRVPFGGATQTVPQLPQLLTSLPVFTSQPLAVWPSQFLYGALQEAMPQTLDEQPAVPFGGVAQTVPQAPQLATLVAVFTSHPSPAAALQSPKPALQEEMPQAPPVQAGVPLATEQATLQAPQWARVVLVSVSHPLEAVASQSPKPALQEAMPQAPPAQAGVPLAAEQTVPQVPQLLALVWVLTQALAQHVPPAPQAVPQAPQLASSRVRSTHAPLQQATPPQSASLLHLSEPPPHPAASTAASSAATNPACNRLIGLSPRGETGRNRFELPDGAPRPCGMAHPLTT